MYLYRASQDAALHLHQPEEHGYACDYLGGDRGPTVVASDYILQGVPEHSVVFLHRLTGMFHPAVRVGMPSRWWVGDDWRQAQAHIVLPDEAGGTFSFYNLLHVLEAGDVTARAAIAAGYTHEAVRSARGSVRPLRCATLQEAQTTLALLAEKGGAKRDVSRHTPSSH